MRIAAIDIGTNSVRCTIVEAPIGGPRRTIDDEKAYTRLGRGMTASRRLDDTAVDETLAALRRMLSIARQHDVEHIRAVATAAVRTAENADAFVRRAEEELGLAVEIISEEQEGRLAYLSAAESVGLVGRSAVIDMGGGSVEIVRGTDRTIDLITSLPIGAVAMSERYHTVDPMPADAMKRLRSRTRTALRHALGSEFGPIATTVGSGGTIITVAALIAAQRGERPASLHGHQIRRAELVHLLAMLRGTTAEERRAMKGMPENRVDIIHAGTLVLDEIMRAIGTNELVVNARGMREGIVIETLERLQGFVRPLDRVAAAYEFARCCRTDIAHAEQVRALALTLFDGLAQRLGLPASSRAVLETAAILHDVGYHIAYERHHKHSYHMISYADLPGFSAKELRVVAAVARYHRGALPKPKHEALAVLDKEERRLVSQLAALLRLADGLDRSRGQKVQSMEIGFDGPVLTIAVKGAEPLDAEIHGGRQKADLFEHVFQMPVEIHEAQPCEHGSETRLAHIP